MSQSFNLQLATDTLSRDAQLLGICVEQLKRIKVNVDISLMLDPRPQLFFDYQVQLPCSQLSKKLDWPLWQQEKVTFTDYLWERTCLECFISMHSTNEDKNKSPYIEINACPNGQYALYQFEDYRTPSTSPPTPLFSKNNAIQSHRPRIDWYDDMTRLPPSISIASTSMPNNYYQRRFSLSLQDLPLWRNDGDMAIKRETSVNNDTHTYIEIELIHPCAILQFDQINLYFAPTHSSPPDFHQRRYWSSFDLNKAL